tara:strand:+ start:198 stop:470 length:273 start_codon:yes stop_codon:yes gene_type:complete
MNEKIELQKEIGYYNNFEIVGKTIIKWKKLKPENKDVIEIYKAWQQIGFYVHDLIQNQSHYNKSMEQYRFDKNRAIMRARKAEEKLEKTN